MKLTPLADEELEGWVGGSIKRTEGVRHSPRAHVKLLVSTTASAAPSSTGDLANAAAEKHHLSRPQPAERARSRQYARWRWRVFAVCCGCHRDRTGVTRY